MTRTEIAFLVAPLVVPGIFVPYFADDWATRWVVAIALIAIVFSYLGTFALGIPLFRYLRAKGWVFLWHAIGAGIASGWLLWFVFNLLFSLSLGAGLDRAVDGAVAELGNINHVWPACVAGAVYGLVFWLISRPDRATA